MAIERTRVNLYLLPEVKNYFYDMAQDMGLSLSAMVNVVLKQQMDQNKIIKTLPDMMAKIEELEKLANMNKK